MAARGFVHGAFIKLVLAIDPDTFAEIKALAEREKRSTASVCRDLLEWGLESGFSASHTSDCASHRGAECDCFG